MSLMGLLAAILIALLAIRALIAVFRFFVRVYIATKERRWIALSRKSGAPIDDLELGASIYTALGRLTTKELEQCRGMSKDQIIALLDRTFKDGKDPRSARSSKATSTSS
jgi:hypothetical protein